MININLTLMSCSVLLCWDLNSGPFLSAYKTNTTLIKQKSYETIWKIITDTDNFWNNCKQMCIIVWYLTYFNILQGEQVNLCVVKSCDELNLLIFRIYTRSKQIKHDIKTQLFTNAH